MFRGLPNPRTVLFWLSNRTNKYTYFVVLHAKIEKNKVPEIIELCSKHARKKIYGKYVFYVDFGLFLCVSSGTDPIRLPN